MFVVYYCAKETNLNDVKDFVESQKIFAKDERVLYLPGATTGMNVQRIELKS